MAIVHQNTSFLLVLSWDGAGSLINLKEKLVACFSERQHVELLILTDKKRPKEGFDTPSSIHVLSSKSDYRIFGKLKSPKRLPTHHTHFDVCMLIDVVDSKHVSSIQAMQINYIVGFNDDRNFVTINLNQSSQEPVDKIRFANELLTKITD